MSINSQFATEWHDLDSRKVWFEGHTWILRVEQYRQRYPYEQDVTSVRLDPTAATKRTPYYVAVKRDLGDDWSIDVLSLDVEQSSTILESVKRTPAA